MFTPNDLTLIRRCIHNENHIWLFFANQRFYASSKSTNIHYNKMLNTHSKERSHRIRKRIFNDQHFLVF